MPETIEFYSNVVEALSAAKKANDLMSARVEQQEKTIQELKAYKASGSENYKGLVGKLASAGFVDRLNERYLKDNVNDDNLSEFLTKLANCIEDSKPATSAGTSPYEVTTVTSTTSSSDKDEYLEKCNKRQREIHAGK